MSDQPTDALTDEQFRNVVGALHAPLVAELRAFGVPTGDNDPLASVRLLVARCRELEQRTDVDAAYQRGLAEGRRQATAALRRLRSQYLASAAWSPALDLLFDDMRDALGTPVGPWETAEQPEAEEGRRAGA